MTLHLGIMGLVTIVSLILALGFPADGTASHLQLKTILAADECLLSNNVFNTFETVKETVRYINREAGLNLVVSVEPKTLPGCTLMDHADILLKLLHNLSRTAEQSKDYVVLVGPVVATDCLLTADWISLQLGSKPRTPLYQASAPLFHYGAHCKIDPFL